MYIAIQDEILSGVVRAENGSLGQRDFVAGVRHNQQRVRHEEQQETNESHQEALKSNSEIAPRIFG